MLLKDNNGLKGHIDIVLYDENGNIKDERHIHNLVVTAGKTYLAAWLAAASQAGEFMTWIGLGEGGGGPAIGDVDLVSPLATRVDGTLSSVGNVWQNQATFGAGVNTGALTEAGLFSASSSGTMFARQVFPVVNKQAADSITITWSLTLG